MRHFRAALLLAPLIMAGCNTSDALVPREEIGAGTQTSPVTQADTARLAQSAQPETASSYSQPMPPPQNTLEAQAQALQAGAATSPNASAPLGAAARAEDAGGSTLASLPPAAPEARTIRFLPIIGAPVQAVTPLSRQLGSTARSSGLTIRGTNDTTASHILKGYLSAYADGKNITVIYVWDILDPNGARLHRIQGQESVPGKAADPWAAVPAQTMETIGAKTIFTYREWLAKQPD